MTFSVDLNDLDDFCANFPLNKWSQLKIPLPGFLHAYLLLVLLFLYKPRGEIFTTTYSNKLDWWNAWRSVAIF